MESRFCTLCVNKCSPKESIDEETSSVKLSSPLAAYAEENDLLNSQLQVIFLLRKMLKIPQEICCSFLEEYGDPCFWIDCCDTCSDLVEEGKTIFDHITMLERRFKILQNRMKNKLIEVVPFEENLVRGSKSTVKKILMSVVSQDDSNLKSFQVNTTIKEENIDNNADYVLANELQEVDRYISEKPDPLTVKENDKSNIEVNTTLEDLKEENIDSSNDYEQSNEFHDVDGYISEEPDTPESINIDKTSHSERASKVIEKLLEKPPKKILFKRFRCRPLNDTMTEIVENVESDAKTLLSDKTKPSRKTKQEKTKETGQCAENKDKSIRCDVCGKYLKSKHNLKLHATTHTGEKPFECKICAKRFSLAQYLRFHEKIHSSEKNYKCDLCGKGFKQAANLRLHKLTHIVEKHHQCDVCGSFFRHRSALNTHQKIHVEEKRFKCKYCEKAFSKSRNLRDHEILHTGEKPFKCDSCDQAFANSKKLRFHKTEHTGQKPNECKVCGRNFISPRQLSFHSNSHTGERPYKCKTCDKSYRNPSDARKHERVAHSSQEKPFKCDSCDICFAYQNSLRVHQRKHTGEKPYACVTCGKRFSQNGSLTKHTKLFHLKN